ncbi:MAG: PIG-L family deacetylase [Thermomicrobiales bacterium]
MLAVRGRLHARFHWHPGRAGRFAHPDDEAFTIGGAISAFSDRGATVTLVTATRGEQGEIAHPSLATPDNLGDVREQELLDAAAILGISSVRFLVP